VKINSQRALRESRSPPAVLNVGTAYVLCTLLTVTTFRHGTHGQPLCVYCESIGGKGNSWLLGGSREELFVAFAGLEGFRLTTL
jgi:hypothetical protein